MIGPLASSSAHSGARHMEGDASGSVSAAPASSPPSIRSYIVRRRSSSSISVGSVKSTDQPSGAFGDAGVRRQSRKLSESANYGNRTRRPSLSRWEDPIELPTTFGRDDLKTKGIDRFMVHPGGSVKVATFCNRNAFSACNPEPPRIDPSPMQNFNPHRP